jgi:hypothetical protein
METAVDSKDVREAVCSDCGVEVRDGSEYCYNCGCAVAKLRPDAGQEIGDNEPSQAAENGFQTNGPGAIKKESTGRRRSRTPVRATSNEPVQVVWERRQDSGVGFLVVSLVAGVIALLLILIAYYLK